MGRASRVAVPLGASAVVRAIHPSRMFRFLLLTVALALGVAACGGGSGLQAPTDRPTAGLLPTRVTAAPMPSSAAQPPASRSPRPEVTLPSLPASLLPTRNPPQTPSADAPRPPVDASLPDVPTRPERSVASSSASAPVPVLPPVGPSSASVPVLPPSASSSPSIPIPPTSSAAPSSSSQWVWWLLGLLIVVVAVVIIVVAVRARRAREAWDAQLAGVIAEVRWLAHEHLPDTLSKPSATETSAIWTANRPRVEALTSSLNEVVASAPKEGRDSVDRLRDAVNQMSFAMDAHAASALNNPDDHSSLGAVQQTQRRLEEALRANSLDPESQRR